MSYRWSSPATTKHTFSAKPSKAFFRRVTRITKSLWWMTAQPTTLLRSLRHIPRFSTFTSRIRDWPQLATQGSTGVECLHMGPDYAFASGHYSVIRRDGTVKPLPSKPCVARDHYLELLRGNY